MKIADFAFAADGNYLMPLRVAVASLLHACRHNPRPLTVHVLDLGIKENDWADLVSFWSRMSPQAKFKRYIISPEKYAGYRIWNGSVATYARLELPILLPQVEWCFYFDCDVLVTRDPRELEETCDPQMAIIGRVNYGLTTRQVDAPWLNERNLPFDESTYICAGVLLMNLDWFRRTGKWRSCFAFLEKYPNPAAVDQTVLNVVCFNNVGLLPQGWGEFSVEAVESDASGCVHFSGKSPWQVHSGWFYFCGEYKLESIWRRFAIKYAGCTDGDFDEMSPVKGTVSWLLAHAIFVGVEIIWKMGLYPLSAKNRIERFLRRCKAKVAARINNELFC